MKPFSITAPEEIAKEYGGDKRKIQQAAAQGLIDPTSAVLAGMFIDRIRGAAAAEQAPQATVAEQVMNPQPQMPSAGLAATPQAAQMQQPMAPQMPQPGAPRMPQPAPPQMAQAPQMPPQQPMGMAMGGGLDSIDFVEQAYAPGGIVSFNVAGSVEQGLLQRRNELEAALRTARIQGDRDSLTQQINAIDRQLANSTSRRLPGIDQGKAMEREAQARFEAAANQQVPNLIAGGTPYPQVPSAPGQLGFELPAITPEARAQMEARAQSGALANQILGSPETFASGVVPRGFTSGQGEVLNQGMEGFASGVVPRGFTDSDPSALNTGMETFAEGVVDRGFTSGQRGGVRDATGRFGLGTLAEALRPSVMGTGEDVYGAADPFAGLITQESGVDAGQVQDLQTGFQAGAARQTAQQEVAGSAPTFGGGRGQIVEQPGERAATTQAAPTISLTDAIEQTNEAAKAGTIDSNTAAKTQAEAVDQTAATTEPDAFEKQIEKLLGKKEKGEFRKETEALIGDRAGRLKKAKNEAFNMALLQAGLGMLGQGGGQTALQALGKAALPAVKDAASAIKDAKKEDRELLQLGLAMEQMDDKERAATERTVAQIYGQRANAMLQSATSTANNIRTTEAQERIAGIQADATKENTRALRTVEIMRNLASDRVQTADALEELRQNERMISADGMALIRAEAAMSKKPNEENREKLAAAQAAFDAHMNKVGGVYQGILSGQTDMQSALQSMLMGGVTSGSQATPLPANPTAANLKVGTVYQTGRGLARYTGKPGPEAFELVQ